MMMGPGYVVLVWNYDDSSSFHPYTTIFPVKRTIDSGLLHGAERKPFAIPTPSPQIHATRLVSTVSRHPNFPIQTSPSRGFHPTDRNLRGLPSCAKAREELYEEERD
jgi:hypothetical protein